MNTCYIFGALKSDKILSVPSKDDLIIAADGGLLSVQALGLKPDLIIGDFDSLGFVPQGEKVIRIPVKKDDTDVGVALKTAFDMGYRRFCVYGALGGRLSHTMANLQLAACYSKRGAQITLYGEGIEAVFITDEGVVFTDRVGGFSVFSFDGTAEGVSISGAEYEISNKCLKNTFPIGVSNRFCGRETVIGVLKGTLAILIEPEGEQAGN